MTRRPYGPLLFFAPFIILLFAIGCSSMQHAPAESAAQRYAYASKMVEGLTMSARVLYAGGSLTPDEGERLYELMYDANIALDRAEALLLMFEDSDPDVVMVALDMADSAIERARNYLNKLELAKDVEVSI